MKSQERVELFYRTESQKEVIVVWGIEGAKENLLREMVNEQDREFVVRFSHPKRRIEHLAWRAALRSEGIENAIEYSETGAPLLVDSPLNIGVAHTNGAIAIIISKRAVAIDIEPQGRDFSSVTKRFVSESESQLPNKNNPLFEAAIWCAKETLYKLSGRAGVELLTELQILSVDFENGQIQGVIKPNNTKHTLELKLIDKYVVTYTK